MKFTIFVTLLVLVGFTNTMRLQSQVNTQTDLLLEGLEEGGNIELFITGAMKPITGKVDVKVIRDCLKAIDAKGAAAKVKAAYADFDKGSVSGFISGIKNMWSPFIEWAKAVKGCNKKTGISSAFDSVTSFSVTKILKNSGTVTYNIWHNWNKLYANTKACKKNLADKKW